MAMLRYEAHEIVPADRFLDDRKSTPQADEGVLKTRVHKSPNVAIHLHKIARISSG